MSKFSKSLSLSLLFFSTVLSITDGYSQLNPIIDSIPMGDGKKLAADIYIPSGMSSGPVILIQTPYNRQLFKLGLPLGIGMNINTSNYIFVVTDWRGFYGSRNAAYIGSPDRGEDGYSTVEWIASQSWSNGKIGTWGPSALGKVQYQTAKTKPPHLTCINPLVGAPQFEYQEYYPGGILRTEYVEQLDQLGYGLSPGVLAHPYYDFTWVFSESANNYPDSIEIPTFMIGGWYDHNISLMLDFYNGISTKSPVSVRDKHKLLMGPWAHGGKGTAKVGSTNQGQLSFPNATNKNDSMSLQFFDFYLRGVSNGWDLQPAITYYQIGDNNWNSTSVWPPTGNTTIDFYCHSNGKLNINAPTVSNDSLKYLYNPLEPSPTVGGATLRNDLNQGPYDQSPIVESRNDVLIFTTDALVNPVRLKGMVTVKLKVSSNRLDTDFDVRLTDVYPDGKSILVTDAALRMRFRNGFSKADESFMSAGTVYDCIIELPSTCITFLPGHKIRLVISSSNYPKYNRNMNNGGVLYAGNSTDSVDNPLVATNVVHLSSTNASKITMPLYDYKQSVTTVNGQTRTVPLYPVPSSNLVNIDLSGFSPESIVTVRDMTGREIFRTKGDKLLTIDITEWPAGVYTLQVEDEFGSSTNKIVK